MPDSFRVNFQSQPLTRENVECDLFNLHQRTCIIHGLVQFCSTVLRCNYFRSLENLRELGKFDALHPLRSCPSPFSLTTISVRLSFSVCFPSLSARSLFAARSIKSRRRFTINVISKSMQRGSFFPASLHLVRCNFSSNFYRRCERKRVESLAHFWDKVDKTINRGLYHVTCMATRNGSH